MADKIDFLETAKDRGYDSAWESDIEASKTKESFQNLAVNKNKPTQVASKRLCEEELLKEERHIHRFHDVALDAYSRHKHYINNYLLYYGGSKEQFRRDTSKDKTVIDVIRENHQFLWEDDQATPSSWEKQLAKKYYDKLFKEYCIADLSHYKENKIGMRWRIEKEVVEGKGQFSCGNKKCQTSEGLRSWEVNFGYSENGQKKNALVKLRLCPDCSYKLNYHHKRKEVLPPASQNLTESLSKDNRKKQKTSDDKSGSSRSRSQESTPEKGKELDTTQADAPSQVWQKPVQPVEEKSREDEYDDYFSGMFL